MPLGWIDFSKTERSKVLNVLDLLMEKGTLDELGISPIRDGFANRFFPGTSTIQTRAKYFFVVPYIFKDLEHNPESNPNRILKLLDEMEKSCGLQLLSNGADIDGIIGSRSLRQGAWVKRTPAEIYWAGLRNYCIFTGGNLSLTEYTRAMCAMKQQKATLTKLGNRKDGAEENESDDKDAGGLFHMQFWKIPTYTDDWKRTLDIKLTQEEGSFLKRQIINAFPQSMMAYILKNGMNEILDCEYYQDLSKIIQEFPEEMQDAYRLALEFSDFIYVLRVIYNLIVSDNNNSEAMAEWDRLKSGLEYYSKINLEQIFNMLQIHGNVFLCKFLSKSQDLMKNGNLEGMKNEIRRRERELKQTRAKTMHPGEFDPDVWFGGGMLDYRFGSAKVIIRDIFESEGIYA